jgi:hypothetical protein
MQRSAEAAGPYMILVRTDGKENATIRASGASWEDDLPSFLLPVDLDATRSQSASVFRLMRCGSPTALTTSGSALLAMREPLSDAVEPVECQVISDDCGSSRPRPSIDPDRGPQIGGGLRSRKVANTDRLARLHSPYPSVRPVLSQNDICRGEIFTKLLRVSDSHNDARHRRTGQEPSQREAWNWLAALF